VHMVICTIMFGSILGTLLSVLDARRQAQKAAEIAQKQLDVDLITSLDKDGDGVDKLEFVLGMLEKLDLISESDYAPFLKQFDALDKTKDGRLSRDDLAALVETNRKEGLEANKAKEAQCKAAPATIHQRLTRHSFDLMLPTFLSCFAFLWTTFFGFVALAAGIMHAVAIGKLLGERPSVRTYCVVVALLLLGATCIITAALMQVVMVHDPAWYFERDSLFAMIVFGVFNGNGLTAPMPDAEVAYVKASLAAQVTTWQLVLTIAIYLSTYAYAVIIDLLTVCCCLKAIEELRQGRYVVAAGTASSTAVHSETTTPRTVVEEMVPSREL